MSERADHGSGEELSPDEFAHLFRPEDPGGSAPPDEPLEPGEREALDPGHQAPAPPDPPLPPPIEPAHLLEPLEPEAGPEPAVPEPAEPADPKQGRLFRSRGGPEIPEAITAVGSLQARRLSTLSRSRDNEDEEPQVGSAPDLAPLPVAASGEPAPALQVMSPGAVAQSPPTYTPPEPAAPKRGRRADEREEPRERPDRGGRSGGTLTALGVYAVTVGVTVILAFGEVLFFGGEPGIITGIGLVVVSVFAAFAVRTPDAINAVFAPPIAFFIAAATAGQLGIGTTGLSGRAVDLFFLLGGNWVWIVGSTTAALVIVVLRRRFS